MDAAPSEIPSAICRKFPAGLSRSFHTPIALAFDHADPLTGFMQGSSKQRYLVKSCGRMVTIFTDFPLAFFLLGHQDKTQAQRRPFVDVEECDAGRFLHNSQGTGGDTLELWHGSRPGRIGASSSGPTESTNCIFGAPSVP